jgi:hypothetical protein
MWIIIVTNEGYKAEKSRLHVSLENRRYRFYLVRHFNNSIPTIHESSSVIFYLYFYFYFCSRSLGFLQAPYHRGYYEARGGSFLLGFVFISPISWEG